MPRGVDAIILGKISFAFIALITCNAGNNLRTGVELSSVTCRLCNLISVSASSTTRLRDPEEVDGSQATVKTLPRCS
jgi:hypothetical protein